MNILVCYLCYEQVLVPVMAHTVSQIYIPVIFKRVGRVGVKIEAVSSLGVMSHTQYVRVSVSCILIIFQVTK